jgi:hypothetical protein
MTDVTYTDTAEPWTEPDDNEFADFGRKRGRFFNAKSALRLAVILGLAGFYAGIRVEKGDVTGSSGSTGSRLTAATAKGGSTTGARPSFGSGGAGGFGGAGGLGGGTTGTVTSVSGKTIYVKGSSGDTVAVKLLPTTTVTKSESVGKGSVHPGDTVAITGSTASNGTLKATAVTDSGDSSTSSASSSTGSSSATTGGTATGG